MKESIGHFVTSKIVSHYFLLLILLLLIIFIFRDLPRGFFEQDEWHSFGHYSYLLSLDTTDLIINALKSGPFTHFTPLSLFSKLTMFKIFGLDAASYFYISVFLHTLVAFAVYFLVFIVVRNKISAFLGSVFFAVNSSHHQAITWIGTFEGAELSVLFGLLSLCSFLIYRQYGGKKWFGLALLSSLVALLFKETAVSFLIIIGVLVITNPRERIKGNLLSISGVVLGYLLLKFNYLFLKTESIKTALDQSKVDFFSALLYNLITVPVKIFSQLTFPNDFLISITNSETFPFDPGIGPWSLEHAFFYDVLAVSLGIFITSIIYFVTKKIENRFPIYLGLAVILTSIMPPLIIKKYLIYLDSRYLYQATVGFSILIGVIYQFTASYKNRKRYYKQVISFGLIVLIAIVLIAHAGFLQNRIKTDVKVGQPRKDILMQIHSGYPQLPKQVVFYTESNSSYYGIGEEKILPFQSGFGQTLLIWYSLNEVFPKEFFENDFLWDIKSQEYLQSGNRGFGYFRDFVLLKKTVKDYNIPISSVIAFSWDKENNKLVDISKKMRIKLLSE